MKTCTRCGRTLGEDCFYSDVSRPDRLSPYCRDCSRSYYRQKMGGTAHLLRKFSDRELEAELARRRKERELLRTAGTAVKPQNPPRP